MAAAGAALRALEQQPSRTPDFEADARVAEPILAALAERSARLPQQIVEAALTHCGAETAGLSVPELDGSEHFRWIAIAGAWAHCRDRIVPREGSPSAVALASNAPLHVLSPERHFIPGADLNPPALELLMVPFRIEQRPIGTLWVIRHESGRQFDAEDLRRLEVLSRLAAIAWAQRVPTVPRPEVSTQAIERNQMELALIAGKMATWHWNPSTDEITASEAMAALFGLLPGQNWISSNQGRALIHPEDRDAQQALIEQALRREGGWHCEFRIVRPVDGKTAWLEERAHRIRNPATGEYVMTGVVWDITERKRAEQASEESEGKLKEVRGELDQMRRLYESILTNTPDLAYVWNLEHRFIYANEGLLKMWGRTWDEAIGKNCLELGYEPWHAAMHDREIDQIIATGKPIRGQVPFAGTYGRRIYDYILVPVFNAQGQVEAVAGTTRDVTESKAVEDRLRYHAQQVETLLNAAPLGVFLLDHRLRVRSFNAIARDAFGKVDQLAGADFEALMRQLWAPPYDEEVIARYRHTLETGEAYFTPERGEMRADRSVTEYYEWRIERIVLPDGEFGIVCYFRDISAQVQARQIIEQSRQALRETDRRKDEFLATLAHELRNPLAPLSNGVRILQDRPGDQATIAQTSAMMSRQLAQLVRLVDDLLDLSRISRGRIELRKERADLCQIIHHAAETIRPACDDMQHQLHIDLPESPLWVEGDRVRLTQAVSNLLTNACRYMERGGNVWISAKQAGDEIELRVRDSGIGIAADQLRVIFDMYSQGDLSLERSQSGLGIGLTLVQSLVGLHGGRITAHSDGPGKGSEFVVRLPSAAAAVPHLVRDDVPRPPETARRRILVVDDNEDSAESLAQLLKLLGHETHTAFDGFQGIELAERLRPDIVLLDIGMPKLNGYDACRQIRQQSWGRPMLIVAQSGWGQVEDKRRSQEAGFDAHLVKPIEYAALLELMAKLAPRVTP
jgi:PAS domain S-box-containing protein